MRTASQQSARNRIVILSTFTIDLIALPIEAILSPLLPIDVQIAPYNQVVQELLNPLSLTRMNQQGCANVLIWRVEDDLDDLLDAFLAAYHACHTPWIISLCGSPDGQLVNQLKERIAHLNNVFLIAPHDLERSYRLKDFYDPVSHRIGDIPFKYEYYCVLGYQIARMIYAIVSKPYKVIVLDCDDTLWSGLCGEEGLDGVFVYPHQRQFQQLLLEQKNAGMLLCICSKNNEEDVRRIFQHHPEMVLKLENFVGMKVNWREKSANIEELSKELNLNLDNFIFIDDSSMECAEVSVRFPQVLTLQLPTDSNEMASFFDHFWPFDHYQVTAEDPQRTIFYQQEMKRSKLKSQSTSLLDFISQLRLNVHFTLAENHHFLRINQLIKRCNLFNFNQLSEINFWDLSKNNNCRCYIISVNDRYGEYGETGVLLLQTKGQLLIVKEFLLSCRVLGKGAEHKILAFLAKIAQGLQLKELQFDFTPSGRNLPAQYFYDQLCQIPYSIVDNSGDVQVIRSKIENILGFNYSPEQLNNKHLVKPEKFEIQLGTNKEKILLRYANELSTLENLIKTIGSYQKEQQIFIRKNQQYIAPTNAAEQYLQQVFQKVLASPAIGIHDDFFLLGGSSLMGTLLISEVSHFYSLNLTIDTLFKAPTIRKLAKVIQRLQIDPSSQLLPIPALSRDENQLFPLSFAQQRIWFLDQLHPNSALYNTFIAFRLTGKVDEQNLVKAFDILVDRHESLRTTFVTRSGVPYQTVHSRVATGFRVEVSDVSHLTEQEIQQRAYQVAQKPFNLTTAPLLKVELLRYQADQYFLFFCSHHILIDGPSFNVLLQELSQIYRLKGRTDWQMPIIQYIDFAIWQRNRLEGELKHKQLEYWIHQLNDLTPLDFPSNFIKSEQTGFQGKRLPFHLDRTLLEKLKLLSHRAKVTVFTTVLSAYAILLSKYTEKKDILIGIPIAGRQYPGVEKIIGHFINILLIRLNLTGNDDFLTMLARNHQVILEAYANQDLPFEELVKHFNPERNIVQQPLTQNMLVFEEVDKSAFEFPDIRMEKTFSENNDILLLADYDHAKLDLTVYMQVCSDGLEGLIEYNAFLYTEETIAGIIRHFYNILVNVCENPQLTYSLISIFDEDEYHKLLLEWNQTMVLYPSPLIVTKLFEEHAQRLPDHVALVYYDQQLSYRLLNQKANQLADYLQAKGVRIQMLVGLHLNRSVDLIVAILAIFKIGAVYLPISPDLPKENIKFLIEDSQTGFILTHRYLLAKLMDEFSEIFPSLNMLAIDTLEPLEQTQEGNRMDVNLHTRLTPHHVAAMIYTSGSTGKPKGVLLKHQGITNTVIAQIKFFDISAASRVIQVASINFDAALGDILVTLLGGATLYVIDQEDLLNTHRFVEILRNQRISVMTVTPSFLSALPKAELPDLKTLVVAGEDCPLRLIKLWAKDRRFINAYGPTEAAICATMGLLTAEDEEVTIGQPVSNAQVYILNQELQPMPVGVPGEIYIAGGGVVQSYHQRSDLNKQYFLPNPFNSAPDSRMFKTGDRGRWLSNGRLQYLGRSDELVKIRGIRTELGAITHVLQEHPLISQAAVVFKGQTTDDQRLIAYVVLEKKGESESRCALNLQHVSYWQKLYNELYAAPESQRPSTQGWESSYTDQPISMIEMEEWIRNTTDRVLAFSPKKLLEVGCGNGLLVQRIAPYCEQYLASDFSEYAINALNTYCQAIPNLRHVCTVKRAANQMLAEEKNSYDTIVLNSVIQYFPHIDYLISVLDQCVDAIDSPGQIYIGDVRNLNYLSAFHCDVQYYKLRKKPNNHQITFGRWKQQVEAEIIRDSELVISPDFFYWYAKRNPKISHVIIELRRGVHHNEMNCFRYDAILHIGKQDHQDFRHLSLEHFDWQRDNFNLQKVHNLLREPSSPCFVIHNVPNRRVDKALLLKNLHTSVVSKPAMTVIEERLQNYFVQAFDPEIFWDLGEKSIYDTVVTFSNEQENGMNVVYVHKNFQDHLFNLVAEAILPKKLHFDDNYERYANLPMSITVSRLLTKQMQEFLRSCLPSHMIPMAFVPLDKMPVTPNGKIDKSALPDADLFLMKPSFSSEKIDDSSPKGKLRKIFSEFLNLSPNQINDQDSFFDMGGHSLLAIKLVKEIEEVFKVHFTIRDLFKASTINEIVMVMQKQAETVSI